MKIHLFRYLPNTRSSDARSWAPMCGQKTKEKTALVWKQGFYTDNHMLVTCLCCAKAFVKSRSTQWDFNTYAIPRSTAQARPVKYIGALDANLISGTEVYEVNGMVRKIEGFQDNYRFLSNFYSCSFTFMGLDWTSSEAAYQAMKFDKELWPQISRMTASEAKKFGKQLKDLDRDDFNLRRVSVMRAVVKAKFMQNPDLAKLLLATGNVEIVETNWWGDDFWGVCSRTNNGSNMLGKILMQTRKSLRNSKEKK